MSDCTNAEGGEGLSREARDARRRRRALELGTRVRGLRGFRRYSQGRLSAITGLSRNYLSELELGRRPRPRADTLERLAGALGVTVEQLRGEAPMPEELGAPDGEPADEPPPPPPGPALRPREQDAVRAAFAFAGLLPESLDTLRDLPALLAAMPPGVIVNYHQFPDGSVLVFIRLPPLRREDASPALDAGKTGE